MEQGEFLLDEGADFPGGNAADAGPVFPRSLRDLPACYR